MYINNDNRYDNVLICNLWSLLLYFATWVLHVREPFQVKRG